ncbi:MAG: 16S rRNA (adenine(1518)-N(6)/adenine(1519)-N(6))-dimethyltransferase RsmA [Pirellulales bacterium]
MGSRNQTISYLTQRFREIGIRPDTRHGQNFLIDLNLLQLLVDAADIGPNDVVLEVGTGTGGLTGRLAERAAQVVTVEIDPHVFELASEELIDLPNVQMLRTDALKNKNRFNPELIHAVREAVEAEPGRRLKLAANLPYNIATPVLSNLLSCEVLPVTMTATIQKELADRIVASPRTKDYSALSIWMQAQCQIEIVRTLPPSVFWPRPKVESAIIHFTIDHARREAIADLAYLHGFVRALFLHRRKFLRSVVLAAFKHQLSKPEVDQLMSEMGFQPDTRAEQLDVPTMLAFCEAVRAKAPDWKLSA